MRSRSFRRHHRARLLQRALFIVRKWHGLPDSDRYESTLTHAAKLVDNRKPCSCAFCGCGNPRRSGLWEPRRTIAERQAIDELVEARYYF